MKEINMKVKYKIMVLDLAITTLFNIRCGFIIMVPELIFFQSSLRDKEITEYLKTKAEGPSIDTFNFLNLLQSQL